MNKTKPVLPCHYPWSSIYVSPNGDVKHCCETNLTRLGNLSEQTIDEIWNGKLFQMIRSKVGKGDFEGAFCNPCCKGIRSGKGYNWPNKTNGSIEIEENENKAIENFKNKTENVNHLPPQLHLEFSNNCNLRCIMCLYEFKPPYSNIPESAISQIIQISKFATQIILVGGEVFMNKSDLEFIDNFTPLDGSWVGFVTNGTYLTESMISRIKKFKRIGMQISIDGTTKDVYEKIRIRGKWDQTDSNIRRIVNTANELNSSGFEWSIGLSYVVMKSNFHNLNDSIKYAIELDIKIEFFPVLGFSLYNENIFIYKEPFSSIGNWHQVLSESYATLEKYKDQYKYYDHVKLLLNDIEKLLQKPKISVSPIALKILGLIVPKDDGKAQGLSKHDNQVGQLIETYYNWKVGNTSLKSTVSYLFFKLARKLKKNKR